MNNECKIKTYLNEYIIEQISDVIIQYIQIIKGEQIKVFSGRSKNKTAQKLIEGNYIRFCMVDEYLHKISINNGHYTLSLFRIMIEKECEECEDYGRKMCKAKINNPDYEKPINCVRVDDEMYIKYIHEHKVVCKDSLGQDLAKNKMLFINKIAVSKIRNETYLLSVDCHAIYVFDAFTGTYLRQFTLLVTNFNKKIRKSSNNSSDDDDPLDIFLPNLANNWRYNQNDYTSMVLSPDENEIFVGDKLNHRILSMNPMTGELLYEFILKKYAKYPWSIALYNNELFVGCDDDKYGSKSQYIMVFDRITRKKLRQSYIDTSYSHVTIAIFGDSMYIPYKKNDYNYVPHATQYKIFDVNQTCDSYNAIRNRKCKNKLNYHKWAEYVSESYICCNDGLFGICHGRAFILSGTYYQNEMLRILK